jgi:hypothetical protein
MGRIRRSHRDSRKAAKLARALALLDAPPARPAPRRSARISFGS